MPEATLIERIDGQGQVSLKADLSAEAVRTAVEALIGTLPPGPLKVAEGPGGAAVWMASDELLLLVPDPAAAVTALEASLADQHALALDVSSARAMFRLSGPGVREVLAKGAPVDLRPAAFPPGTARRTHLGQVAVGFWLMPAGGERFTLICFRSVASYVEAWLREGAAPGAKVGFITPA
ncbi:MAG: sarcosine oxidase subunit gamma family protein [Pseudomonadota bacterium]